MNTIVLFWGLLVLIAYMSGMVAARWLLNWSYGTTLRYPDLRRRRNLEILFWLPLLIAGLFYCVGMLVMLKLSGHPRRSVRR